MKNLLLYLLLWSITIGCGNSGELKQTYFPDGSIETEITYVDGLKNGPFVYYNNKGGKWKEGVFTKDSLDGLLIFYSMNGIDTNRTALYRNGELLETTEEIDHKGEKIKIKSDYKNKLTIIYGKSGRIDTTIKMK